MLTAKLYVPIKIAPRGRSFMSVHRNDHVRVIAFSRFEDAQFAADVVSGGVAIHVIGELLTTPIVDRDQQGEFIVLETSAEALSREMQDFGVDMCDFVHPHFINLTTSFIVDSDPQKSRSILEKMAML